jgi:hypothetical protein
MKIKSILLMAVLLTATVSANAQEAYLIVNSDVRLPKDSVESAILISTLNDFLIAAQQANEDNKWVLPSEKSETELLIDEMKGMDKHDSIVFAPHLINIEQLPDKKSYSVQISYMGVDKGIPILRATFEFIAHKTGESFLFSSPLLRNTRNWHTQTAGYLTIRYEDASAADLANQWIKTVEVFDKKLNISAPMDVYLCDDCNDMACMLRLTGVNYNGKTNGLSRRILLYGVGDKTFVFYAQQLSRRQLDPHDLFHWRANSAISEDVRNHYMVCGAGYVYGGSWGISWEDIRKTFKERMKYDKNTDWLKLYFDRYNFGESQAEHLLVTQYINALIIQKTEKEQGFSAVMDLLGSGNFIKEKENFFNILEKTTGINEKNFNKEVWKLINEK